MTNPQRKAKRAKVVRVKTKKLTKKQESILHTALSLDDLLFRKFERLNQEFMQTVRAHRRRSVASVVANMGDYQQHLMIEKVYDTEDGYVVVVRQP